jgi:hypothetical protein
VRYRKLSSTGDYTFGSGSQNFFINSPDAVGQAVQTALRLWLGEWYLNINDGTPYPEGVLGKHSQAVADATIVSRIRKVQGVVDITNYQSTIDPVTRKYTSVSGTLTTAYGTIQIQVANL